MQPWPVREVRGVEHAVPADGKAAGRALPDKCRVQAGALTRQRAGIAGRPALPEPGRLRGQVPGTAASGPDFSQVMVEVVPENPPGCVPELPPGYPDRRPAGSQEACHGVIPSPHVLPVAAACRNRVNRVCTAQVEP